MNISPPDYTGGTNDTSVCVLEHEGNSRIRRVAILFFFDLLGPFALYGS